jgi:hypothetical protein
MPPQQSAETASDTQRIQYDPPATIRCGCTIHVFDLMFPNMPTCTEKTVLKLHMLSAIRQCVGSTGPIRCKKVCVASSRVLNKRKRVVVSRHLHMGAEALDELLAGL